MSNIGEDLKNFEDDWNKDPLGMVLNLGLNTVSFGTVGYEDGKLKRGAALHALDEGIGEVTGRNQAREANYDMEEKIAEEGRERKRQQDLEYIQDYRMDLLASRSAAGARATENARATRGSQPLGDAAMKDEELLGV